MRFDRDSPFPLQIHGVEKLVFHLALADGVGALHQAITQRGLAMVDVRNNAEISDLRGIHFSLKQSRRRYPSGWWIKENTIGLRGLRWIAPYPAGVPHKAALGLQRKS